MAPTFTIVNDFAVGDQKPIDHLYSELPGQITTATLGLKRYQTDTTELLTRTVTTSATGYGQILNPGTIQADGTYTAEVLFVLSGTDTSNPLWFAPGQTTWGYITMSGSSFGPTTPEVLELIPFVGGANG